MTQFFAINAQFAPMTVNVIIVTMPLLCHFSNQWP